jgi:hypothetical protein
MFKSAIQARLARVKKSQVFSSPPNEMSIQKQHQIQNKRPLDLNPAAVTKNFKYQKTSKDD